MTCKSDRHPSVVAPQLRSTFQIERRQLHAQQCRMEREDTPLSTLTAPHAASFGVQVVTMDGRPIPIENVSPESTVLDLKGRVSKTEGLPIYQQMLFATHDKRTEVEDGDLSLSNDKSLEAVVALTGLESSAVLELTVLVDSTATATPICLACSTPLPSRATGCKQLYCKPCRQTWGEYRYDHNHARDMCWSCGAMYNHQVREFTRSGKPSAHYHDADACSACGSCRASCFCA